jgi:hypothetical protein
VKAACHNFQPGLFVQCAVTVDLLMLTLSVLTAAISLCGFCGLYLVFSTVRVLLKSVIAGWVY